MSDEKIGSRSTCKHCFRPITLHNFALGPDWRHDDSTLSGYGPCRISWATPAGEVSPCSRKEWCRKRDGHQGSCYPFHAPAVTRPGGGEEP